MSVWAAAEGSSSPLGATWIDNVRAWNFAIYSKHAHRVTLLLYGEADLITPVFSFTFDYLRNKSGNIWHCRLPRSEIDGARYYAYSMDGPAPQGRFEWHCFDPDKILLDPYAKSVFFPPSFDRSAAEQPGSNAGKAPLGLLAGEGESFDWGDDQPPRHEAETVIYELHVRGFTKHPSSGVSPEQRGTFCGVVEKIPYLLGLGVTNFSNKRHRPTYQKDRLCRGTAIARLFTQQRNESELFGRFGRFLGSRIGCTDDHNLRTTRFEGSYHARRIAKIAKSNRNFEKATAAV